MCPSGNSVVDLMQPSTMLERMLATALDAHELAQHLFR